MTPRIQAVYRADWVAVTVRGLDSWRWEFTKVPYYHNCVYVGQVNDLVVPVGVLTEQEDGSRHHHLRHVETHRRSDGTCRGCCEEFDLQVEGEYLHPLPELPPMVAELRGRVLEVQKARKHKEAWWPKNYYPDSLKICGVLNALLVEQELRGKKS